jgi:segregation and condensation protein B
VSQTSETSDDSTNPAPATDSAALTVDRASANEGEGTSEGLDEDLDEGLGAPNLACALEALVLVAVEPLSSVVLAQLTRVPVPDVESALKDLSAEYDTQGRGFELREVAGGWRFFTRDTCAEVVERFVRDGQQARLTQAALETLAVIAYKQPVTRARISAIRGVNVDGVVRTLLSRGLIEEAGHEESSQAILYVTTSYFLERMGVASLEDLPPIGPLLPDAADAIDLFDSLST